ncbi:MAG: SoxR reducing system RseC family protein [Tannerella sp.]|jgi:sigma-E factor negative regulatory protein RseC|nr:SoxR reducing system RseC family protein [Tannerella sp.]
MKDLIQHQGIIEKIERHRVFVRIEQKATCSACHARSACLVSDKKEKIIEIDDTSGRYTTNEQVIISAHSSVGFFAVIMAFTIPLILVIIALIIGMNQSGSEGISGLAGLSILIPYYFILYIFRDRLKKKCVFSLSKVQDTYNKPNQSL